MALRALAASERRDQLDPRTPERGLGQLPEDEQSTVLKFLGAYLRDFRAKQAYA